MGVITLNNVSKRYGTQAVVDNFDLEMAEGEFIVPVGPRVAANRPRCAIAGLEEVGARGASSLPVRM